MPALVNHLIQLRDGILALRKEREDFLANLELASGNRRAAVANLLTGFSCGLQNMARRSRVDRVAFLANLQEAVAALRRGVRVDLAGGRLAFERLRGASPVRNLQATKPKKPEPAATILETSRPPESEARSEHTPETAGPARAAGTGRPKGGTRRKRRR